MSRLTVLFLLAVGLLLGASPMFAATFIVGTCKPSLPNYTTISAAVSGVPSGSTVEVCPGTYAEQVTIAQPLTLKGITSGNTGQVVIAVPGSGLAVVTSAFGSSVAPQVAVTAGPVNISDITVDGTGNTVGDYPTWLVGIFYASGSSGTVNEVTVRNLSNSGLTAGAWAENASATNELVTIENSSFHDIDDSAVVTMSNQSAPFATVKANSMETAGDYVQWGADGSLTGNVMNGGYELVIQGYGSGTVSGNTVANSLFSGITVDSFAPTSVSGNTFANSGTLGMYILSSATISSNAVTNSPQGIYVDADGVSVTSNKISNASGYGIFVGSSGDTFQSNTITKTSIGIEFNCLSATVLRNTINDATTGIDSVPGSFSGANSFDNAVTLRTGGCGFGPIHGPDLPKAPHSGPMPARVAH